MHIEKRKGSVTLAHYCRFSVSVAWGVRCALHIAFFKKHHVDGLCDCVGRFALIGSLLQTFLVLITPWFVVGVNKFGAFGAKTSDDLPTSHDDMAFRCGKRESS